MSKEKIKIVMYPSKVGGNNYYLDNVVKMLEKKYEVFGWNELSFKEKFNKDVIILNWFGAVGNRSLIVALIRYLKRYIYIYIRQKIQK